MMRQAKKGHIEYPLSKPISTMKVKELKEDLKKRELKVSGSKSALQERLRDFLQSPECLRYVKLRIAVFGFTRKFQEEYRYNVPIPLQHLIYQYCQSSNINPSFLE